MFNIYHFCRSTYIDGFLHSYGSHHDAQTIFNTPTNHHSSVTIFNSSEPSNESPKHRQLWPRPDTKQIEFWLLSPRFPLSLSLRVYFVNKTNFRKTLQCTQMKTRDGALFKKTDDDLNGFEFTDGTFCPLFLCVCVFVYFSLSRGGFEQDVENGYAHFPDTCHGTLENQFYSFSMALDRTYYIQ